LSPVGRHRIIRLVAARRPGILSAVVFVLLYAAGPALAEGDHEYWAKAAFVVPVSANWRFSFEERLTFGDEARRLDDHQMDYCLTYWGFADWLGVGLGYKQTFEKDDDDWRVEDRPLTNIILKTRIRDWAVVSRSRFEYRIPEEDPESWRYRNQVTILSPATFTPLKILPYISDEIFIDLDEADFSQQRLYGGCFIPLHEKIRLELFYLWKLSEQDDGSWHDTNVLGSYLCFFF
jgi:hypothetical protein